MKRSFFPILFICIMALANVAQAQQAGARQDGAAVRKLVEQFLQTQTAGLPAR